MLFSRPAARRKAATWGQIDKIGYCPLDDIQAFFLLRKDRDRCYQPLCVRMKGLLKKFSYARTFDYLSRIHYRYPVCDFSNHAQVMGDKDHSSAHLVSQVADQVKYLSLYRYIQGSGGLVSDEQVWTEGKRHGDHYTLCLTARHLVGVRMCFLFGIWDVDHTQEFYRALPGFFFIHTGMDLEHLG